MNWNGCWVSETECSGGWSGVRDRDGDGDSDDVADDSTHWRHSGLVCGLVV